MKKKVGSLILFILLTIILGFAIWICDCKDFGLGEAIAGAFLAFCLERIMLAVQDLTDTTDWKTSQRMLKRGGFINDDTIIRISFAYLYRVKVAEKYLLVQNARNTGKYQPIGGVYKFSDSEKLYLKKHFQVKDDNKIPIDESSRNDYRLRMESKYLRKFFRRFIRKADRELIDNLGREFKEELIDNGVLGWNRITYRFCGRHITNISFSEHFQIYEVLLADVVELLPTKEQEQDLRLLMNSKNDKYRFATADEIKSLGVDTQAGNLQESIGDHTIKILEENEGNLKKIARSGNVYTVIL